MAIMLTLALMVRSIGGDRDIQSIEIATASALDEVELPTLATIDSEIGTAGVAAPASSGEVGVELSEVAFPENQSEASAAATATVERNSIERLMQQSGAVVGGGFEGRTKEARSRFGKPGLGTPESEDAVERGLAWLAAHQRPDGGWRFDLAETPCRGVCRNSGTVGTSTGATALALLSFLGAGYLPSDSKYGETVNRGLYYLISHGVETKHGIDLQEGTMYAHGLAAIALAEAYAMSGDEGLRAPAQGAIDFICHAQHPHGGWRYYPGQPGDTTVFGWQLMALKSGQLGKLRVPSPVIELARQYLDSVQLDNGSFYGYQKPAKDPSPTAVGLLSRMYYGWRLGDNRLARGVEFLGKRGPSPTDMYYNYYATNVLHHYGGPWWYGWNEQMRNFLVATQSREGHEAGSWFFVDQHGNAGGRLYTTAMCIMILEVYYRHMPLYGEDSRDGF